MLGRYLLLVLCLSCGLPVLRGELHSRGVLQPQTVELANASLWSLIYSQHRHRYQRAYLESKMKEIMEAGADINCLDEKGYTPLHRTFDAEMVAVLIEFGADVNARSKIGLTPLHYSAHLHLYNGVITSMELQLAMEQPALEKVKVLIENNADVNAKTDLGITPLQFIMGDYSEKASRYLPMVDLLAKGGANINDVGYDGETFLHKAVQFNHKDMVELLVKYKADVNARDKDGLTPLHLATARKSTEDETNAKIINLLENKGAH